MLQSFQKWRKDYISEGPRGWNPGFSAFPGLFCSPFAPPILLLSSSPCAMAPRVLWLQKGFHLVESSLWKPWLRNSRGKKNWPFKHGDILISNNVLALSWSCAHPVGQSLLPEDELLCLVIPIFNAGRREVRRGLAVLLSTIHYITMIEQKIAL